MHRMMPAVWAHDSRPWLANVRLPVLVMGGSEDEVTPIAHVRALHAALPEAQLAIIEGGGHVPIGTHAQAVKEALQRFFHKAGL